MTKNFKKFTTKPSTALHGKPGIIQSISKVALLVLATVGISACSSDDPVASSLPTFSTAEVTTRASGMVVSVRETADVTIHTLTAPEAVFANSTHIIETENSLVAIDTQFLLPNAQDMRDYADGLGKPIDRVYITHEHPDHFLGSQVFNDRPVFALQAVSDLIQQNGDAEVAEKLGDFGPDNISSSYVVPQIAVPGVATIDGVAFLLEEVLDAEAQTQLVIKLPDHGVVATGDIVYSGVHLILAGQTDTWTTALQNLSDSSAEYPIVLPGHGVPAALGVYDTNISWLAKARELIDSVDNFADFKQGLVDTFPELGMDAAIDFVQRILFPSGE
jgi:glyoxylase-like metal-dependent hydrolase (beta-lactamase superfamily II)